MADLRVCYLINSLGVGGAERFLIDLITHVEGVSSTVLCLYNEGEWAKLLREYGVDIKVLGLPKPGIKPRGYTVVANALRKMRPDIVHTFLEGNWYGLPAAFLVGIPGRVASLQNCYWHWSLKLRIFDWTMFSFAQVGIACSRAVKNFFVKRVWYPKGKIRVIYNGADPSRFLNLPEKHDARRILGLPQDRVILTTVGSLTPQKGHTVLLEALKEVVKQCPNVLTLFVGDGGLRTELETLCAKYELGDRIIFMGKRQDIPVILSASDIFAFPSLWEGLPLALIEAYMSGLPVVASQVDGIAEVVIDGETGLLVPPHDTEALSTALIKLVRESELRNFMGRRGREIVLERFTIQRAAQEMLKVYQSLVEK